MAKKIGAIVSLVIVGIVIVTAIILANTNISYNIECLKPDYIYIQTTTDHIRVSNAQKDEIVNLINEASKERTLTALFNGDLGKKAELITEKATLSSPTSYYVRYKYNTKQDLVVDKKEYKNSDGQVETYEELVFVVNQFDGETEYRVYVIPESENAYSYSYYFKLTADFGDLYSYLENNF